MSVSGGTVLLLGVAGVTIGVLTLARNAELRRAQEKLAAARQRDAELRTDFRLALARERRAQQAARREERRLRRRDRDGVPRRLVLVVGRGSRQQPTMRPDAPPRRRSGGEATEV